MICQLSDAVNKFHEYVRIQFFQTFFLCGLFSQSFIERCTPSLGIESMCVSLPRVGFLSVITKETSQVKFCLTNESNQDILKSVLFPVVKFSRIK